MSGGHPRHRGHQHRQKASFKRQLVQLSASVQLHQYRVWLKHTHTPMSVHFTFAPSPIFLPAQGVKYIHTPMTMSVRFTSATTSLFFTCTRSKTHTCTNGLSFHFCPYIYFLPAHGGVKHTHTHTNVCSFHFCPYSYFLPAQGTVRHTSAHQCLFISLLPLHLFLPAQGGVRHTQVNSFSFDPAHSSDKRQWDQDACNEISAAWRLRATAQEA